MDGWHGKIPAAFFLVEGGRIIFYRLRRVDWVNNPIFILYKLWWQIACIKQKLKIRIKKKRNKSQYWVTGRRLIEFSIMRKFCVNLEICLPVTSTSRFCANRWFSRGRAAELTDIFLFLLANVELPKSRVINENYMKLLVTLKISRAFR